MARLKPVQKGLMLLPVEFFQQVIPGGFERALCYLVDHELDASGLRGRYRNDAQRASTYVLPYCSRSYCCPIVAA